MIFEAGGYARAVTALPRMVEGMGRPATVDHVRTISRDVQLRLAFALAESGYPHLRPSFGLLLERLRDGALPVGQVATALGVSPQAASRDAQMLERFGYVARAASAVDGRSRMVALTDRGHDLMARAGETFAECEYAYEQLVGRVAMGRVLRDLEALRVGLGLASKPRPTALIRTTRSIGSVILIALDAKRRVVMSANLSGHHLVRPSHIELLTTIGTGGDRVSDIARELRVTRQAVSATVQDLEGIGYIERRPDSTDKRAVLIAPSARGEALLDEVAHAVQEIEAHCQAVLGGRRWTRFVGDLTELSEAVSDNGTPDPPLPSGHPVRVDDLNSLAAGLRNRLGARRAARLGALLAEADRSPSTGRSQRLETSQAVSGAGR